MRQRLEILILTSIDTDTFLFDQRKNEQVLTEELRAVIDKHLGEDACDEIELESGEPI